MKNLLELANGKPITFMVDRGKTRTDAVKTLVEAQAINREYVKLGYTFLPQESPVVSSDGVTMHYTSTNYDDWCNS